MTAVAYRTPDSVLQELGISEPDEIDLEAIAQHLGATVLYEPLSGCDARILGNEAEAIITVDSRSTEARQRFSIGHELGHWMRDRGKTAFACTEADFTRSWKTGDSEKKANEYSADLLLPREMFRPRARDREVTFETVKELANEFRTSITATTIRIVTHGWLPSMVIYVEDGVRKWFIGDPDLPRAIWPLETPGKLTVTADLLSGKKYQGAETIRADAWIDHVNARRYELVEDAMPISQNGVLTLLWWKSEQQLIDLDDED